jgi:hypothetical protein
MNRRIGFMCIALCATFQVTTVDAADKPKLSCDRGGDVARYGGTEWLVYGCSDGKTLAFFSAESNPANPYYFILAPKDGGYQLYGEGTGEKRLTDAAYVEIQALTPVQISALLLRHGAASP